MFVRVEKGKRREEGFVGCVGEVYRTMYIRELLHPVSKQAKPIGTRASKSTRYNPYFAIERLLFRVCRVNSTDVGKRIHRECLCISLFF